MYQSIYKYAKDKELSKKKNRVYRKIAAYILLDKNGDYQGVEVIPKKDRIESLCYDAGKFYTSKMACPACDKKKTILGDSKHDSFLSLMEEASAYSNCYATAIIFVKNYDNDESFSSEVDKSLSAIKDDEFLSFRVDGINIEDERSTDDWFDDLMASKSDSSSKASPGVSVITGTNVELLSGKTKFPMCKCGSVFETGVPIFSNSHKNKPGNACAFKSYGAGSEACPMSIEEAETIQAGLETLLKSENNHNNDFSIVFWFDDVNAKNILNPIIARKRDEKMDSEYEDLLESIISGNMVDPTEKQKNNLYHIMQYNVPDKGRFSLSREKTGTYREMAENIVKWYDDTSIAISQGNIKRISNLWAVLLGLLQKKKASSKYDEVDIEFGPAKQMLLESVYDGKQIPRKVYKLADEQILRSMIYGYYRTDEMEIKEKYYPWTALMVIKAYLMREGIRMREQLDTTNKNIGYLCGRWLAVLDMLQDRASDKKLKVSLGEKMYKGCTKNPAKILSLCSDNKNIYLSKIDEGTKYILRRFLVKLQSLWMEGFFLKNSQI